MREIQQYIKEKAERLEERLTVYMEESEEVPLRLREAMAYSLLAGGKRLRPVLVLAVCESLGGNEEKALPFGCAVEMIHTYSLIHDDLPAMDDDDYRRGRLTNHKVYGDAMAILAGDALLTKAFGIFAEASLQAGLEEKTALSLIREGSRRTGGEGMVGGQVKDILGESRSVNLEQLRDIHRSKTGDLIVYSVRLGAWVAGASPVEMDALTRYAERLGLAFQIQDDVLNVIGDREKMGKPVGSDEEKNKATYPALLGLEESRDWVRRLVEEAKDLVRSEPGIDSTRLMGIADYLTNRDQ
ncbi:polyprenyl synthetase family protein [Paludifilum halophilum]|uniref:Farnesyl diphosphate synthase n=1 Tax=Paludifilum halophilum TaxID=1642702 RepID=A0A235BC06_9BACL|nr:farnesyl diphosphate synthase [Paludifilum halophilum]OYD09824.1 polyprenyl synthetase [Paludifilum halophilum]